MFLQRVVDIERTFKIWFRWLEFKKGSLLILHFCACQRRQGRYLGLNSVLGCVCAYICLCQLCYLLLLYQLLHKLMKYECKKRVDVSVKLKLDVLESLDKDLLVKLPSN